MIALDRMGRRASLLELHLNRGRLRRLWWFLGGDLHKQIRDQPQVNGG